MIRIVALALALTAPALVGCGAAPTPPTDAQPTTPKSAAAAWADAYNARHPTQLRALVHPERRDAFDHERATLDARLGTWRVARYVLGEPVTVDDRFAGYTLAFELTDGRRLDERAGVLVEADGRWWVWQH